MAMPGNVDFSLVLAPNGDDAYAAGVLARSLVALGGAHAGSIVVHHAPDAAAELVEPFRRAGHRINAFRAGAAGGPMARHLTALAELPSAADGAWLFAGGIAVGAPLIAPQREAVAAKLVDGATVPRTLLAEVWSAARLDPLRVDANLLYVPRRHQGTLCESWLRFSAFLAGFPGIEGRLAGGPADALALALALAATRLPLAHLAANDVRAVRFEGFDAFGLLAQPSNDPPLSRAIAAINEAIAEPAEMPDYVGYKRARAAAAPTLADDHPFAVASSAWARAFPNRVRLVLHTGTPKTGTTALQQTLYRSVGELAERGIWYPPARVEPYQKKHQFLVDLLLAADAPGLAAAFDEIVAAAPAGTHTIVLSTEGLFNHWWDYPPASKALLHRLGSAFAVELWTCFREPLAFALAQHAQLLRNPRTHSPAYGLDIGLEEILDNEWFVRRLDYLGFVLEAQSLAGERNVRLFRYGPTIVARIMRALGADPPDAPAGVNPSLRESGVDLMRVVNRYDLPAAEKSEAAALVLELDRLIGDRAGALRAGAETMRRIRRLTARGWHAIEPCLDVDEGRA